MDGFADDAKSAANRLAAALLLALLLHLTVLLVAPLDWRVLSFPAPHRFEVVLLPPVERPAPQTPLAVAELVDLPAPTPSQLEPALPPEPVAETPPLPATPIQPPLPPIHPALHSIKPVAPSVKSATPPPKKPVTPPVKPVALLPKKPAAPPRVKPRPVSLPKSTPLSTEPASNHPVQRPAGSGRARPTNNLPSRLDSAALLSQIAGIEAEHQHREALEIRSKRVSPTDTQSPEGFYIAAWVRKVEQIGAMNFPPIARKLDLNAGPTLDVAIRADGSLQEVLVVRSSGHAELDQAAQQIVRLGAPYAPFPPQLRQRYDVLRIARPWRFDAGGRIQSH
ncbi:MAG: TonB family protein [Candidatus Contendobacter sp.]|nr:TonB family protein [Candidatus Contendobacter sp.]